VRIRLQSTPSGAWLAALEAALETAGTAPVVLLEGQDPSVSGEGLAALLENAAGAAAAVPAVAVRDTYKRVRDGLVLETVDREGLAELLQPWIFERGALERAVAAVRSRSQACESPIDLCRLAGVPVRLLRWPARP
jgi:2-C-methyl-D-erythritol 4-phosphate cytidylyltransferase